MAMDFVAGTIGGCAGIVVGHPFDLIKVRLQMQPDAAFSGKGNRGGFAGPSHPSFKGPLDCLKKTVSREGVSALFKGLGPPIWGNVPIQAIIFGTYGTTRRLLSDGDPNKQPLVEVAAAGCVSGFANSFISTPTELIKIKLQLQESSCSSSTNVAKPLASKNVVSKAYSGLWDCARDIYRTTGIKGLYRGFGITLLRDAPAFGIYFAFYEGTCRALTAPGEDPSTSMSPLRTMVAGCICGAASWALTYPLDVVKTRLQSLPSSDIRPGQLWRCVKSAYEAGGTQAFFKGFSPTVIRAMPVGAVTFLAFETIMYMAQQ